MRRNPSWVRGGLFFLLAAVLTMGASGQGKPAVSGDGLSPLIEKMVKRFGAQHRTRIEQGVRQVRALWKAEDGPRSDFETFCQEQFIADPALLAKTFERIQTDFESILGNCLRISRDLSTPIQLDRGDNPIAVDNYFAEWSPTAHLNDDFYGNRLAFYIILNFPHFTLEDKLSQGPGWDRRQWAMAKLGDQFTSRVPAAVNQIVNERTVQADNYISQYNIFMGRLLDAAGKTPFPEGMRLISHWGIRDELKSHYGKADGLPKQELVYQLMLRIIDQSIPARVIDKADVYWDPAANKVFEKKADGRMVQVEAKAEPDTRYTMLLKIFQAQRKVDPFSPASPSLVARRFNDDRQIPEEQVEKLLTSVLSSPLVARTASLIEKRLGRKLRPFDIWYDGFKSRSTLDERDLDARVGAKYPTVQAFQTDLPNILTGLGFSPDQARFLSERIVVDPSRGVGHAQGAEMRSDQAHLRTRAPAGGMNYKGYNIAVHELGHNVEQVFSLHALDEYFLRGVPNTGFTEALAFVFQSRDLDLLGIKLEDPAKKALATVDDLWMTYEISGVSLVDMKIWRWLYAHPTATPAQLKAATLTIAREVWNAYYAPIFGEKDIPLLAIYSHIVDAMLYLPDYALGHIINFQIESYLEGKNLGAETERMFRLGNLTPRLWMQKAVGEDLSTAPLLKAAGVALEALEK